MNPTLRSLVEGPSSGARLRRCALATVSGCLWFLAVTPFDCWPAAWIAAVPMLLAIDRAPTWREALWLGWWAGVVETAGGFYWLADTTVRFAGFPWIAGAGVLFAFCATRALIFLLFTAIVRLLRGAPGDSGPRLPLVLIAPLALPVCELVVPQIFPCGQWISQAWHPLVIQISELTGPAGVSALLMMVNGALYDGLAGERRALRHGGVALLLLAATLGFGALRMRQVDAVVAAAPRLKVGLVQPNFAYSVDGEFSREEVLSQLAALQAESRRLQQGGAELLVWSEGAYPIALPRNFQADFPDDSLAMIRRGFDVPVLIGANTVEPGAEDAFNSALLLDGAGRAAGRYDKVRLLAFGEYIPGIETFPWLRQLLPPGSGRFIAGSGPGAITLQAQGMDWRLAPVICYEDLLPGYLHRVGELRPNLLVNLTSDSWFGAGSEPWEHLALSVFATVEMRVALVRAVNSGISALVDPNGRLVAKTYANDPYRQPRAADGLLVSAPRMPGGDTLYVAWGNWFAYACTAAMALGALFRFGTRFSRRS